MSAYMKSSLQGLIGGAALLVAGIYLLISAGMAPVAWTLVGVGILSFITGLMGVVSSRMAMNKRLLQENSDLRTFKITVSDERNAAITEKTKAVLNDFTAWTLWSIIIVFALMQVEFWIVLVLVGVFVARMILSLSVSLYLRRHM